LYNFTTMPRKIVVAVDQSEESKKLLEWAAKVVLKPEDHVVAIYCIPEKAMFGFGELMTLSPLVQG